jgi:hypothetical protein
LSVAKVYIFTFTEYAAVQVLKFQLESSDKLQIDFQRYDVRQDINHIQCSVEVEKTPDSNPHTFEKQSVQNYSIPQHYDLDGLETEKSGSIVPDVRSSRVLNLHDPQPTENSFLNESSQTEPFEDGGDVLLDINNIQCSVDVEGTTPFNYEFSSSLSSIEIEEPSNRYLLSPDLEDIIPPTLEEQCREPVQNPPKPQHWDLDGAQ